MVDDQQLSFECALERFNIGQYVDENRAERENSVNEVLLRTQNSDPYWHARALHALGRLYGQHCEHDQALRAFVPAADILLLQGCNRDAASALFGKARTLDWLCVPDEQVLDVAHEAWEAVKHLEPSPIYGDILLLSGWVLLRMGRLVDAFHCFEKGLSSQQYVGAVLNVADALSWLGHLYLHTGAYPDAYSAFEAAAKKYADLGDESPDRQAYEPRCKENMERIKSKQENPDQRIGFYRARNDRDVYHDLFYPPEVTSHP